MSQFTKSNQAYPQFVRLTFNSHEQCEDFLNQDEELERLHIHSCLRKKEVKEQWEADLSIITGKRVPLEHWAQFSDSEPIALETFNSSYDNRINQLSIAIERLISKKKNIVFNDKKRQKRKVHEKIRDVPSQLAMIWKEFGTTIKTVMSKHTSQENENERMISLKQTLLTFETERAFENMFKEKMNEEKMSAREMMEKEEELAGEEREEEKKEAIAPEQKQKKKQRNQGQDQLDDMEEALEKLSPYPKQDRMPDKDLKSLKRFMEFYGVTLCQVKEMLQHSSICSSFTNCTYTKVPSEWSQLITEHFKELCLYEKMLKDSYVFAYMDVTSPETKEAWRFNTQASFDLIPDNFAQRCIFRQKASEWRVLALLKCFEQNVKVNSSDWIYLMKKHKHQNSHYSNQDIENLEFILSIINHRFRQNMSPWTNSSLRDNRIEEFEETKGLWEHILSTLCTFKIPR